MAEYLGGTEEGFVQMMNNKARDDLSLIAVIMKAPTTKVRFAEAQKLLDYGFNNYSCKVFGKQGEVVQTVTVDKGVEKSVNAVFETQATVFMKKGQEANVEQTINLSPCISAPIEKGQTLGEVIYTLNSETIATVNLIAENEVKKVNLWNMTTHLYKLWFNVLR